MATPRTMFDKIWDRHVVLTRGSQSLLYVDRHLVHDGSFHAFEGLRKRGLKVRRPGQTFGTADHYVPTTGRTPGDAATPDLLIAHRRTMVTDVDRVIVLRGGRIEQDGAPKDLQSRPGYFQDMLRASENG